MSEMEDQLLEGIRKKLDSGAEYEYKTMRIDLILLMNTVLQQNRLLDDMIENPENEKPATEAALRILHRTYQDEVKNHDNTTTELKIVRTEYDNLRRWVRLNSKSLAKYLTLLKQVKPQDLESIILED